MIFGKYAAIGGALTLGALWPFATGQIAQVFYDKEMADFRSPYVELKPIKYERGYLSSSIVTQIVFKNALLGERVKNGLPPSFEILTTVSHGYVKVDGQSALSIPKESQAAIEAFWPDSSSVLGANFTINLLGNVNVDAKLSPLQSKVQGINLASSAATFQADMRRDGLINFAFNVPEFSASNMQNALSFTMQKLNFSGQGRMENGMWVGQQHLSSADITLSSPAQGSWQIIEGNLQFENKLNKAEQEPQNIDLWRIDTKTFAQAQQIKDKQSALNAKNVNVGFAVEDIDYESFMTLANLNNQLTDQELIKATSAIGTLLSKGLKMNLPLEFDIEDQGVVNGFVNLSVEKGAEQALSRIDLLFDKLNGQMKLSFPKKYIDEQLPIVNLLKQQGFVTEATDNVELSFSVAGDEIISSSGTRIPYKEFLPLIL